MKRRTRILLVVAGLLGAVLLYQGVTSLVAYTDDAYVRSDLVALSPQVGGQIVAVHVTDNQAVKRGDRLASIDPVPFQLAVAERQARIDQMRAQLAADRDAAAAADAAHAGAQADADYARDTQRRLASLVQTSDAAQAQLDEANDVLARADATVAERQAAAARAHALLAVHQAELAAAEAALATAQWQLTQTGLVAPVEGIVNNLSLQPGDMARAGEPLIGIVDAHAWRIVANYKQSYLPALRIGQTAWVWLDSHPWRFYRARIAGIARGINRQQGDAALLPYVAPTTDWIRLQHRFPVTMTLVDPPPDLTLYMGADARTVIFP
ncbi:MAG: HlyD family efflux transporter periplasmic adaptor subunit [Acetobacteraceae bacterium]